MKEDPSKVQSVSIVICSKNRHDSLLKTLQALVNFSHDERLLELIIVEETGNPQPPPGDKIRYFPIPERGFGFGYVRNFSLSKAKGSIIIFLDDDVFPSRDWFSNLLKPFQERTVAAVGGAILPFLPQLNRVGKGISLLGFPAGGLARYLESDGKMIETNLISTGNCAFRAELAHRLGGFDESLRWGGEDQDFFSRIREVSKTIFMPSAIVYHCQRESYRQVFSWFLRRGKAEFFRKCKHHHPLKALFFPFRSSFLLKVAAFLFLFISAAGYSALAAIASAVAIFSAWGVLVCRRAYAIVNRRIPEHLSLEITEIRDHILNGAIWWDLFPVKVTMDFGHEIGKLLGFSLYLSQRIFSKPLVLAFHHLGNQPETGPNSQYYYSSENLSKLVQECQRAGRRIVPLSQIVCRLRENPRSLYFEKALAITFDDAYSSLYKGLERFCFNIPIPISVFVPTAYVGKSNKWDLEKNLTQENLMGWEELANLKGRKIEIGSHSRHHFRLTECDPEVQRHEIMGSLEDLKCSLPGISTFLFSYPYGACNRDIQELVKHAGYLGAVSNFAGNIRPYTDPFEIPRFTVLSGDDWKSISTFSRSMWVKDFLRDIRDRLRRNKRRL